ncbi:cytochrome c oxidase subunit 6b-1-like [Chrysoperla carnea]|uniref:cytochrome c oxidase subunit 6b-1-like n=1 Tax=Chrysoperla carnea TaxID=189513 RepID=UPI001D07DA3D|nr:cytochrome c oxidase subunit 6b-1-like [Chrysoperla carnea]
MSGVYNFIRNYDAKSNEKADRHCEDECDVLDKSNSIFVTNRKIFDTSNFTLSYVQNKKDVSKKNVKIKLLTNVPESTLENLPIKSSGEPEKSEHGADGYDEGGEDEEDEKNEDDEEEAQTPDQTNFSFDFVKNSKTEDVKIELLANEPETPKEDDEEKIETPQLDPRFPNQNQTSHCWSAYVDYHRCVNLLGDEHDAAKYFKKVYTSMCPNRWVERWDEQRENGTFPAIIDRVKSKEDEETCDETKEDFEECKKRQEEKQAEKEILERDAEAEKGKAVTEKAKEEETTKKKKKSKKFFRW